MACSYLRDRSKFPRANRAVAHFEHLGARAEGFEQILIGAGEPGLAGIGQEFVEQRRAAHRVQMGGGFVDQDQRRPRAGILGQRPRLRQSEPEQQRLLFAGRALIGGHILGGVAGQ
jgi:hypothetical protein